MRALRLEPILEHLDGALGIIRHPEDLRLPSRQPGTHHPPTKTRAPDSGSIASHSDTAWTACRYRRGRSHELTSRGDDALVYNRSVLPEDVLLVRLVAREQEDDAVVRHEGQSIQVRCRCRKSRAEAFRQHIPSLAIDIPITARVCERRGLEIRDGNAPGKDAMDVCVVRRDRERLQRELAVAREAEETHYASAGGR